MRARRAVCIAVLGLMLAGTAFAQRGGGRGGFGGGFRGGGFSAGRVGGHTYGRGGFIAGHQDFAGRIGFNHNRFYGGARYVGGYRHGYGGWYGGAAWPGAWWPATYVADYSYGAPYPYWASPAPTVTVVTAPALSAGPSVIVINEPREREQAVARDDPEDTRTPGWRASGSPLYLIAMKDGTIWAARAYSVEDGAVQIITRHEDRKSIPLDQIDRSFTEQLNRERRVDFRLP